MTGENKGAAFAILGVIATISVVGLILVFKGATGNASLGRGPFIQDSPQRACGFIHCESGLGSVVIGEENHLDGDYWVCGCPEHFENKVISDWSNEWTGDPARGQREFNDYEKIWRIRKIREY